MRVYEQILNRAIPITKEKLAELKKETEDMYFSGRSIKVGDKIIKGILFNNRSENISTGITFHPDEVTDGTYELLRVKVHIDGKTPYLLNTGECESNNNFFKTTEREINKGKFE